MGLCFSSSPPDEDETENHPHFAGGNVTLVTTKDAWDRKLSEAKTQGKIVIANFSASWCGPCKSLAPYYIELSETHPSLMFLTVDVDELTDSDRNLHKIAINNVNEQDNLYRGIRMLISPTSKESASSFSKFIQLSPSLWKQSLPSSNSGCFDFEVKEFSTHWEVKATPTFFFLRDGQQFDKLVGANKSELQKKITTIVDSQVPAGQK